MILSRTPISLRGNGSGVWAGRHPQRPTVPLNQNGAGPPFHDAPSTPMLRPLPTPLTPSIGRRLPTTGSCAPARTRGWRCCRTHGNANPVRADHDRRHWLCPKGLKPGTALNRVQHRLASPAQGAGTLRPIRIPQDLERGGANTYSAKPLAYADRPEMKRAGRRSERVRI